MRSRALLAEDGSLHVEEKEEEVQEAIIADSKAAELTLVKVDTRSAQVQGLEAGITESGALQMETDEIMGLTNGADDYMTKPFSVAVLKLRLQNILSRKAKDTETKETERIITSGEIVLDLKTFRAFCGGEEFNLSMTEFRLLQYFMEHKGQALLKEQILRYVWDIEGNFVEENTLSVNVSRLRKKLGRDYIRTIQGIGYLWEENG